MCLMGLHTLIFFFQFTCIPKGLDIRQKNKSIKNIIEINKYYKYQNKIGR